MARVEGYIPVGPDMPVNTPTVEQALAMTHQQFVDAILHAQYVAWEHQNYEQDKALGMPEVFLRAAYPWEYGA